MTAKANRIENIFQDARELQADALEMLARGRIRNAAEKAWGRRRGPPMPWCWLRTPSARVALWMLLASWIREHSGREERRCRRYTNWNP